MKTILKFQGMSRFDCTYFVHEPDMHLCLYLNCLLGCQFTFFQNACLTSHWRGYLCPIELPARLILYFSKLLAWLSWLPMYVFGIFHLSPNGPIIFLTSDLNISPNGPKVFLSSDLNISPNGPKTPSDHQYFHSVSKILKSV